MTLRLILLPAEFARRMLKGMANELGKLFLRLKPKRRWTQFSLGTLLVSVTLLCIGLGLAVVPAERQRRAFAALEPLGADVWYAEPGERASNWSPPAFLRRWLPRDYFDAVQEVHLRPTGKGGAGLALLSDLKRLQILQLNDTEVANAELIYLEGLVDLKKLYLDRTQIGDEGLASLQELKKLQVLGLDRTQVTSAGLVHLASLRNMQILWLDDTRIAD